MRPTAPACTNVAMFPRSTARGWFPRSTARGWFPHWFPRGFRAGTRLVWLAAALSWTGAAAGGCTAAKASVQILSAEQALHRAEAYQAPEVAVYEYTMATEYLDKAREEAGYSDYRIADALARKSAEWSDRAIIFVERHGRGELNLEDLSDTTGPPAPKPAPTSRPIGDDDDEEDEDVVPEDDDGLDPP